MQTVWDNAHLLQDGLLTTLSLSFVVIVASTLLGVLLGTALLYGPWFLRAVLRLYVDVVRGMPLLVLMFLIYYGVPALDVTILGYHVDTNINRFLTAAIAFSMFGAAHIGEITRGSLNAIPRGQTDAAKALGLTFWPRLKTILIPQALPTMIPPAINTAAEIVKATSLVLLISMNDLLYETQKIAGRTGDVIPMYATAAAVYFVICFTISRFGTWVGGRYRFGTAR